MTCMNEEIYSQHAIWRALIFIKNVIRAIFTVIICRSMQFITPTSSHLKLKYLLDRKTLTTMYTSFIRPGLEYASIVFCNCTETEEDIPESVQKRAFKIITGGIVRTPTNYLYNEIGLEPLKQGEIEMCFCFSLK